MAHVAVIGSGLMGSGIAQVAAVGGWDVLLVDADEGARARADAEIRKPVTRSADRGKVAAEDAGAARERIVRTTDVEQAAKAEIVVEAVFERIDVKQEVFRRLSAVCAPETVLATNTSAIPITEIASAASHPERVVGT